MDFKKKLGRVKEFFKRRKKQVIIILALVLVGVIVKGRIDKDKEKDTFVVKRGTVAEELVLTGEIAADEHANLKFQSSGEVGWLGVTEGDWVEKGQALARLDTTSLFAAKEKAVSDLRSAQATLDRVYDEIKGHDEDESYEQKEDRTIAEVARDKAYRSLVIAEESLANTTLKAPFGGVVSQIINPFSGINVLFSETQIEIVNPETIYFEVVADQSEVIDLYLNQQVLIVLDSFPDKEIEGIVRYISYTPMSGEVGTVYKVKVVFDEPDPTKFRIGMTGDASFTLSSKENALYVPPKFINSNTKGKYVNLRKKNNKVYVDVGIEGEDRVEIIGEVKEGDTIYD